VTGRGISSQSHYPHLEETDPKVLGVIAKAQMISIPRFPKLCVKKKVARAKE
jgi:hypothetical protein